MIKCTAFRKYLNVALFGFVLNSYGCTKAEEAPKRSKYGANSLEEAVGVFYRIEAQYTVIETNEPIDFDYVMSCYNRDVPGSFHGILKPITMFKATREGQAIAIAPPQHYCQRGLNGQPIEQERDMWKMPMLAWFPDVNDLSYSLIYASNDAYTGPKAKVRFRGYKVTKTTRALFHKWQAKAEADYKQIGAIPGPFGCTHFNGGDCNYEHIKERNGGRTFALPEEGLAYARKLNWPTGSKDIIKDYLDVGRRYYCSIAIDPRTGVKYERHLGWIDMMKGIGPPKEVAAVALEIRHLKQKNTEIYLDPQLLLNGVGDQAVRELYPTISFKHPREENMSADKRQYNPNSYLKQIVLDPEWKGFAISYFSNDVTARFPEFKAPEYTGRNLGVLYVNDVLACENPTKLGRWELYDLDKGFAFSTAAGGPQNTSW